MSREESAAEAENKRRVQSVIDAGLAHPSQCKPKEGSITYQFIGGLWDGASLRTYPTSTEPVLTLTWNDEDLNYEIGPPKDGRSPKLTYRLQEDTAQ